jgi:carbonic anhydrase/acetyltransferase-like protein (isoleucine patch superfamily)
MKHRTLLGTLVLASLGTTAVASATVHREGEWPDAEKPVTVDVTGVPRSEAIRKLAEAAGWSIVVQAPPGDPVDIHIKGQPAGKVLELLLSDGDYVAHRDGTLVDIHRSQPAVAAANPAAPAPSAPPAPPAMPMPPAPAAVPAPPAPPAPPASVSKGKHGDRGEDRVVTGGSLRVEAGETVHDVAVFGGSVDVYGTVTGDIAVMGGSARIHKGAKVKGDATAVGGTLRVDDGAEIEGDAAVVGGALIRDDGAHVGGKTVNTSKGGGLKIEIDDDDDGAAAHHGKVRSKLSTVGGTISSALTSGALLFVFGAVLLALGAPRMETLQGEVAARPMRTFALGVVGLLASFATIIALCVTVVGIPFAVIGMIAGALATFAGLAAVLTTAGGALLAHRTKSPYVHLALGCGLFAFVTAIPYLGDVMGWVGAVLGVGVLVATRAAGLVNRNGAHGPYRTAG